MMRSLSSAVAGLRSHQTKMDVIGNNIANVNTYGFKSSRVTFADVYYQNVAGSRAGTQGASGGKNPTQIGYGSAVATIDIMTNTTGAATTNRALDAYITGEGFLVCKDVSGRLNYTRLGNMGFDSAGNLVDGSGNLVQGFPMRRDADGNMVPNISADGTIVADQLQGINIDPKILEKLTGITITTSGAIIGMLEGDPTAKAKDTTNPSWINGNSMSIPETSTYSGPINLAISGFTDVNTMASALGLNMGDVTNMEMGTLALPGGDDYKISVDKNGNVTMFRPAHGTPGTDDYEDAVELTGALKDGKLVLKNKAGDVGLTITMDKSKVRNIETTLETELDTTRFNTSAQDGGGRVTFYDDGSGHIEMPGYVLPTTDPTLGDPTKLLYEEINGSNPIAYQPLMIGGVQAFAAYATKEVDKPHDLKLELYSQMTTTDKGGNVLKFPATPELFVQMPLTEPDVSDVPGFGRVEYFDSSGATVPPGYVMPTTDPASGIPLYMSDGTPRLDPVSSQPLFLALTTPARMTMRYGDFSFDITGQVPNKGINQQIATAEPGDSVSFTIGNLVLAKFQNPSGLHEAGTSYFQQTSNSGEPAFVLPGLEGTGALKGGALEMSNVDVAGEFTDMITTQRGFQANSRIITVSDEMLQELVNLKR